MNCFPRTELQRFLAGELSAPAAAELASHVEDCAACERALAELAGDESLPWNDGPADGADTANLEPSGEFLNRLHRRLPQTSELHRPVGPTVDWPFTRASDTPVSGAGDPATDPVPAAVPGYEILGELSRGGMGVVYKARQVALNRVVALKMILTEAHAGQARRARFRTEAEAVARLQHPNIVQIYDIGEHAGCPYFSMELIDGPTLTEACRAQPQPPAATAALVETVARAIHCAHLHGIIHRDLKPDNILLAVESGARSVERGMAVVDGRSTLHSPPSTLHPPLSTLHPKIIDFGLAKRQGDVKLTQHGQVLGTPSYMAPEQVSGKGADVGPATDVYALGAVLYELLTGRPPFLADSVQSTLTLVIREEPIPLRRLQPKVPRDLETICLTCLEKNPARRYARASDLAEDLRRFQAHEPIAARPPSAWDRWSKFARRNKPLVAGLAGTLAALLVGTIVSVLFAVGESRQRRLADDNAQHMEDAQRQAQWEAYEARLAVAQARIEGHSVREAAEQLDKAPEHLRRWEWFHLQSRLDDSVAVVGAPGPLQPAPMLLTPSGRVVFASKDRHVSLWDANNTRLKHLADGELLGVASSRTGSLIFVAPSGSGDLLTFDDAGRPGPTFGVSGTGFRAAALTGDGTRVALAGANKTKSGLALFDAATGAMLSPLLDPQHGEITALAFSADGKRLVVGTWDGYLELWDMPEFRVVAAWRAHKGPHKSPLQCVSISPDGRQILSIAHDERCSRWEVPTGRLLEVPRGLGGRVGVAAYSPDGKWIAATGKGRVLLILSAASGDVVAEFHGHSEGIPRVAYSPDGRSIWTASEDGTARCYDLAPSGDPRVLLHDSYVYGVAYSPHGRWFASAGWHTARANDPSAIHLWDAASGPIAVLHGPTQYVASVAITPDGKRLASLDNAGSIHVWDIADGRGRKLPLAVRLQLAGSVHRLSISPDGRLLAVADDRQVRLWDLQSDKEESALSTSLTGVRLAVFSPDGTRLAVAGGQPEVHIVSVPKGEVLAVLRGYTGLVHAVAFSPDGSRIVTAGDDRSVRLWDAATGELQTVFGGAKGGHTDTVFAAVFHPDGKRIATAGRDRAIRIWDTASGEELVRLAGHTDYVFTLAFSPDGKALVSGSGDATVRLWDTAPLRERYQARRELEALRPEADALVERLFRQGFAACEVVERLRSDPDLGEALRRAAWHAVLRRGDANK